MNHKTFMESLFLTVNLETFLTKPNSLSLSFSIVLSLKMKTYFSKGLNSQIKVKHLEKRAIASLTIP